MMEFSEDGTSNSIIRDGAVHPLVQQPDGTWFEFDLNGVPLGSWYQDTEGNWSFIDFGAIPLGAILPQTGELSAALLLGFAGTLLVAAGLLIRRRRNIA